MKIEKTNNEDGSYNIELTCENCGKPIVKTDELFGMTCEDECIKKIFLKPVTKADCYVKNKYSEEEYLLYKTGSLLINDKVLNEICNKSNIENGRIFRIDVDTIDEDKIKNYIEILSKQFKKNR